LVLTMALVVPGVLEVLVVLAALAQALVQVPVQVPVVLVVLVALAVGLRLSLVAYLLLLRSHLILLPHRYATQPSAR